MGSLALPADSELPALLAAFPHARALRFSDEEFLIRAAEPATTFYLLLRGTCLVEMAPPEPEEDDGEPQEARRHGAEMFTLTATPARPLFVGEMACFGDGLRSASVRSSMNSIAVELNLADLHAILEAFPRLTRTLCEQFSERLSELNRQLSRHREHLMMQARQEFFENGAILFSAGEPAARLYQLVDGAVALLSPSGEEMLIRPTARRAIFIEPVPYFVGGAYGRTAVARGVVIAVSIAARSREAVVRNFPHLTLDLLAQAHAQDDPVGRHDVQSP